MSDREVGLRIKGMTLGDGTRWVVQELDLLVPPGALHMVLGERDTGKTALLEAIAGGRALEKGSVGLEGKAALIPQTIPPAQLRVLDRLVLRSQPRFFGLGIRWRAAREQARALGARFGIEGLLDVPIEALRPLERRLVELAAAVSESPAALLLDEPTSDLGPHEARLFLAAVKAAAMAEKIPALYTSSRPRDAYPDAAGVTIIWRGAEPVTVSTSDCTEAALVERWTGGAGIRRPTRVTSRYRSSRSRRT